MSAEPVLTELQEQHLRRLRKMLAFHVASALAASELYDVQSRFAFSAAVADRLCRLGFVAVERSAWARSRKRYYLTRAGAVRARLLP